MAIIDSHCILFEGPLSAESTGKAVPLTALRLGWRFVPQAVRKSWLRLKLSPAGSGSHDGHIFAALLREEDFPYEKELRVR